MYVFKDQKMQMELNGNPVSPNKIVVYLPYCARVFCMLLKVPAMII